MNRPGAQTLSDLIFVRAGECETLRISGVPESFEDAYCVSRWRLSSDFELVSGRRFHCSKCVVRSDLWTPQAWPALDGLPSLAQTMVDAAALPMPVEALQEIISQDEAERLY